jgi:hypothetical protein
MSRPTPPAEFDEYALDMARRIASIDRARLPGGKPQFLAVIQTALVDAMMFAAGTALEPHVTVKASSIAFSPAMPIADHEMDVLRSIAHRLKPSASNFRNFASSSTENVRDSGDSSTNGARVWTEPVEEAKSC